MANVSGKNSNKKAVKQTAENRQKILGDDDMAGVTAARHQESEATAGLALDRAY